MTALAYVAVPTLNFAAIWLGFLLGYALLAWHAMFSAIHGQPPGRRDAWWDDWMQTLAYKLVGFHPANPPDIMGVDGWRRFGIIYGAIRATTMMPAVIALAAYRDSWHPLVGVAFLGMGYMYFLMGKAARHFNQPGMAVPLAEISMGWCIGTYLLICAR